MKEVLSTSSKFIASIQHNPSLKYPRFATVSGSQLPTVKSFKAFKSSDGSIRLTRPLEFISGDTVVSEKSAKMPIGYKFKNIDSLYLHPFMMNDLKAVSRAFSYVMK